MRSSEMLELVVDLAHGVASAMKADPGSTVAQALGLFRAHAETLARLPGHDLRSLALLLADSGVTGDAFIELAGHLPPETALALAIVHQVEPEQVEADRAALVADLASQDAAHTAGALAALLALLVYAGS